MTASTRVLTFSVVLALPVATGSSFAQLTTSPYTPPRVNYSCPTPAPDVAESATVNAEHGEVILSILVSTRGHPLKVLVVHSSGFDDLDNAAVEAAATWHYLPAVRYGGNISDWMGLKMEFGLNETGKTFNPASTTQSELCGR